MRKLALKLLAPTLLMLFPGLVLAQTRGTGVGALFSDTEGDTTVSITNVKTAPWSEVIVENSAGEIQAVAKLDGQGLVNFTFEAQSADIGSLSIYAADEAGATNKVLIAGTSLTGELLPPTIVSSGGDEETAVLGGFSFPGAEIAAHLISDRGYDETLTAEADGSTGEWEINTGTLEGGEYTAAATSSIFSETSQESQELTFSIAGGGIVNIVVTQIGPIVSAITQGVTDLSDNIAKAAQNLPDNVKNTANTTSKAAVPISLIALLLNAGVSTLDDLFIFLSSLLRVPLVPFLLEKRKKKTPWGTVYDAFTKHPLSRALVRLTAEDGKLKDTVITDEGGAFSFLPPEGSYKISPAKAGYRFPSQLVSGKSSDGEYANLYFGGDLNVTEKEPVVATDVPLDPQQPSGKPGMRRFFKRSGSSFNLGLLTGGLILSGITYLAFPGVYNQIIAGFYVVTLSLVTADTVKVQRTWGIIKDEEGNPVEAVAISLVSAEGGQLVARRVSNEQGRYQIVAGQGRYKILIASIDWERIDQKGYYSGEEIEITKETDLVSIPIAVRQKAPTALKRRETI